MGASLLNNDWVIYVAYALIGMTTFILGRMLLQEEESRAAADNLSDARDRQSSNPLVRLTRPFFVQYFVPIVRGKPFWDDKRKVWRRKLITSGLRDELTPDELIAFKALLIIVFPLFLGLLRAGDIYPFEAHYILGSAIAGWFYPNFWINSRITKRQKQIRRSLPFVIDLLALSTEAGLDFVGAIGKVVEKSKPSPLVDEFGQLLKEIKVGSSRSEGMREMALRIDMTEVNSFIAILISAEQMGASIGKILRQQSEQIRSTRMLLAEKAGARAASMMLLPMMLFILPAVFLMIMGPFILSMMGGGGL